MQAFSFGHVNVPGQRNYVFVDEHNRHKRLKVMRACEGCRRRKIRCDAATTNTWPCSACNRLKLQCVPPTPFDQDFSETGAGLQDASNHRLVSALDLSEPREHGSGTRHGQIENLPHTQLSSPARVEVDFQSYAAEAPDRPSDFLCPPSNPASTQRARALQSAFLADLPSAERSPTTTSDHSPIAAEGLCETLGALKIDETGVAPYLRRPSKHVAEPAAPVPEQEPELPPLDTRYGSQIRIPPALMPSAEDAAQMFNVFFSQIHPYVPVVIRTHFYQQWQSDRLSIPPLLLEAMLACAGPYSNDPVQGAQWLALANKHEDFFLDTPRLSTIQALLLLLKARESAPKRGYYYRSWMTCKTIASMAKDLDLHEHSSLHADGQPCGSTPVECLTKTRVWQTLMVCETMIGGPQGRYDYEVVLNTVDQSLDPPCSNNDPFDKKISRQFAYFVRNVCNIRAVAETYHALKRTKDWQSHPKFLANNQTFDNWVNALPPDLQLNLPSDGSPPWMTSHFIGNMHSHYHLGRMMLQRPQLMASKSFAVDSTWKQHMSSCYASAKVICRLQETILAQFGLPGLLYMQRGINFTIYAVLTCIMLHLVAVTSPDPEFYIDARDWFTRHMRILEECMNAWPMEEMKAQIDALREAFSADKNKPFELKPSFPHGTPSESYAGSSPREPQYYGVSLTEEEGFSQPSNQPYPLQTMTPPMSRDSGFDSPHQQQQQQQQHHQHHGGMAPAAYLTSSSMATYPQAYLQQSIPSSDNTQWNPTPIFHQWDAAFSIPPSALAPPPRANATPSSVSFSALPQQAVRSGSPPISNPYLQQYAASSGASLTSLPHQQQYGEQAPTATTPSNFPASFVSPREWQQSVASVVDPLGRKRRSMYAEVGQQQQPPKRSR